MSQYWGPAVLPLKDKAQNQHNCRIIKTFPENFTMHIFVILLQLLIGSVKARPNEHLNLILSYDFYGDYYDPVDSGDVKKGMSKHID